MALRVQINGFVDRLLLILTAASLLVLASILYPGHNVHADDLPVIHVSGTLTEDTTWSDGSVYVLDSTIYVPNNITLTIAAGTIIKNAAPIWVQYGITVNNGGTLDIIGTSGNPVIFTSFRDDSVGGDSNGDGSSNGAPGDYDTAIHIDSGGTATVSHATLRNGNQSFYAYCLFG